SVRHFLFFFNDTATTEIYTLSTRRSSDLFLYSCFFRCLRLGRCLFPCLEGDRKSTRLNSSHLGISYAVFCLKKKSTICPPSTAFDRLAWQRRGCTPVSVH